MEEEIDVVELMDLDPELLQIALVTLNYQDLLRFCTVSKKAAAICRNEHFWKLKVKRDFGRRFPDAQEGVLHTSNWREEYKYYLKNLEKDLLVAVGSGDQKTVQELLGVGVNPNAIDKTTTDFFGNIWGQTALIRAAIEDHSGISQL